MIFSALLKVSIISWLAAFISARSDARRALASCAAVFAPRFLHVKRYPHARFVADEVTRTDGDRGRACGKLTLHGTTRPLCMDLVLNKIARYPLPPFRRTIGFSATAQLKRSEFGMTSWRSLVGDEVELRIEAELFQRGSETTRSQADAGDDDATPPHTDD